VERVFKTYRERFVWRAAFGIVASMALSALIGLMIGGPFGFLLAIVLAIWAVNRAILTGNRWVRDATAAKLQQVGEHSPAGRTRFVGLAHPAYLDDPERRQIESDDDVGFLTLGRDGLAYRGDASSFDVPYEQIGAVTMSRSAYAPWPRVRIEILDGEPYDAIIIDSRDQRNFHACQQDCRALYDELHAVVGRIKRHGGQRLHAEAEAEVQADA